MADTQTDALGYEVKIVTKYNFDKNRAWSKQEDGLQELYDEGWRVIETIEDDGYTNAFVLERPRID